MATFVAAICFAMIFLADQEQKEREKEMLRKKYLFNFEKNGKTNKK